METNIIAWNDKPLNFNGPEYEFWIKQPTFKIEYFGGEIRVYMNEIL